ncbi:hypothetical protein X943_002355 [Babesia divergens]|uniref:Spindle assembly abnormal protein 6 N-terminal domain-containing protein n=1 Tax=Babesia divergens TaxID=32595 RepID=A0AAD9LKI9_BABDI|nr:hypothetical protein X943_002355 [Babesia divergens]
MRLHLSHECDAEIRTSTSELKGVMCRLNFKLVGGADVVELELTSESDLFFNYIHRVTRDEYTEIFDKQRLTAQFESYASTLTKMIRSCMKDKSFRAVIFMTHEKGTLHFIQTVEHKFLELLQCRLRRASEFRIVDNITYRYNALKERVSHFAHHLKEINDILETKDPELIRQRLHG